MVSRNITARLKTLLTAPPRLEGAFDNWILQQDTPQFLVENANSDEIIIKLGTDYGMLQTVVAPADDVSKADPLELREWDMMHDSWGINYEWGDKGNLWLSPPFENDRGAVYRSAEAIVVQRSFAGFTEGRNYFEILQKLTQAFDLHFVAHKKAWCRLDANGDIEPVVQHYQLPEGRHGYVGYAITIKRSVLNTFLVAGRYKAICAFDFTRTDPGSFSGWGEGREQSDISDEGLIYRLTIQPRVGSYLRGVQILDTTETLEQIKHRLQHGEEPKQYASFIAFDAKNNVVADISCAPGATANYFTKSDLPYEVTPAFFKPEVLQKYRADTEKYRFDERTIYCRGSWSLKTYDINEEGQVHTYLVYLRDLPFQEQLYWKSFNEKPKGTISKRAFTTDIKGDFYQEYNSLQSILALARRLDDAKVKWWTLKNKELLDTIHYPATDNADEWAEEILRLDQLIVEGFNEKWLRKTSEDLRAAVEAKDASLVLMMKLLPSAGFEEDQAKALVQPLRELHHLRSKVKGHAKGTEAKQLQSDALKKHGTFRKHFEDLAERCDINLRRIAKGLETLGGGDSGERR